MEKILETERLALRKLTQNDYADLCKMLQDAAVMYAYEGPFSDAEAHDWLDRQLGRYAADGFGLWAVILKATGALIGQCGLTLQDWRDKRVVEIGYLFNKDFWHKGCATEAAAACKSYAFDVLGVDEVFSIIRDSNAPSRAVAERNGMAVRDTIVKHYRGVDMPHLVYSARREGADAL